MRFLQIEKKLCKKIEKTFKYVLTSWIHYDIILIVELRNRQKSNKCECAGIGRQARLRGVCFTTYGFKSRHSHHRKDLIPCVSSLFYFASKRWRDLKATVKKTVLWDTLHKEGILPDFDISGFMLFSSVSVAFLPYGVGSLLPYLRG